MQLFACRSDSGLRPLFELYRRPGADRIGTDLGNAGGAALVLRLRRKQLSRSPPPESPSGGAELSGHLCPRPATQARTPAARTRPPAAADAIPRRRLHVPGRGRRAAQPPLPSPPPAAGSPEVLRHLPLYPQPHP